MLENFISDKISKFRQEHKMVICSGNFVDFKLNFIDSFNFNKKSYLLKDFLFYNMHIFTPSILFRRSFLANKNLFLSNLSRGQELELFSRLFYKLEYKDVEIIDSKLFLYRFHDSSMNEKDKLYNKKFKESLSYVYIENLKRSIFLKDRELIIFIYLKLIDFIFRGMENEHFSNVEYILKNLRRNIYKVNKLLSIELFIFIKLLLLIKRGSYSIEKKFRKYELF